MKKLILLLVLTGVLGLAQAQKRQNVYFLKNNGINVATRDSADYIRIIQESDSGEVNYKLMEYYLNGKVKALGTVSKFDPFLILEGQYVTFDENGAKRSMSMHEKNMHVSKGYHFFHNGKVKKIQDYAGFIHDKDVMGLNKDNQPFKMEYLADSLGNVLINDGNGHFKERRSSGTQELIEEGDYVDGFKDGLWSETNTSGDTWYKEKFMKGKLLSGESFKNGQSYLYAVNMEFPNFNGGMNEFYRYLARSIRYPQDAMQYNISGKVYLSFVVNADGSLSDIKVERGVSRSIDQEAVRVLSRSPKWIPGKQRGIPVRVKYNIPVSFSLGR